MTRINVLKRSTTFDKSISSHRMVLEIISAENISRNLFIKQRLTNFVKNTFDEVFVAISTPTQLEDFNENAPAVDSSYYRVNKIELVSRNADYLDQVLETILVELQKLIDDQAALNNLRAEAIYQLTAGQYGARTYNPGIIQIDTSIAHTHYRLPLVAEPAGTNETEDGVQRVASENINAQGWLNCVTDVDPPGYKFKYNIPKDSALSRIWPPTEDKVQYAHLEVNGITDNTALITTEGIYWKDNKEGNAPWPLTNDEQLILVIDLLV